MFGITCFIEIDSPRSFDLSAAALVILVCTSTGEYSTLHQPLGTPKVLPI